MIATNWPLSNRRSPLRSLSVFEFRIVRRTAGTAVTTEQPCVPANEESLFDCWVLGSATASCCAPGNQFSASKKILHDQRFAPAPRVSNWYSWPKKFFPVRRDRRGFRANGVGFLVGSPIPRGVAARESWILTTTASRGYCGQFRTVNGLPRIGRTVGY
jgi:hypothetical protein